MNTRRNQYRTATRAACAMAIFASLAVSAVAQESATPENNPSSPPAMERAKSRLIEISNFRPHDARALNQFEPPKAEGVPYDGFKLSWGAAFTQQFQGLKHENTAVPVIVGTTNVNQLIDIGNGFNN